VVALDLDVGALDWVRVHPGRVPSRADHRQRGRRIGRRAGRGCRAAGRDPRGLGQQRGCLPWRRDPRRPGWGGSRP